MKLSTNMFLRAKTAAACAALLLACFAACALERAEVITKFKDGSQKTAIAALEIAPDGKRLRIPKESISPQTEYIDIIADDARAQKGESGYFVFDRGEYCTFRLDSGSFVIDRGRAVLPVFGVKTPRGAFMGIVKKSRLEYETRVEISGGVYKIFPRFKISEIGFAPYEDIAIDFVEFPEAGAGYNEMAKHYRDYIYSLGEIKPLRERVKTNPVLARIADKILVRFDHCGSKKTPPRSTPDVEPQNEAKLNVHLTFAEISEIAAAAKKNGWTDIYFELTGWQAGGYDGRLPSIFPIPEEFGGEDGLRKTVAEVEALGYPITMQSNHTQILRVSDMWSEDYIARNIDGSRSKDLFFLGGQQYNMCLKHTWDIFVKKQIAELKRRIGFKSGYYTDVYSAVCPYLCTNPAHPSSRAETLETILKSLKYSRSLYGVQGSECGFDFCLKHLDFIHYVSNMDIELANRKKYKGNVVMDGIFPLWEIVYHGAVLHTSGRQTQNFGKLNAPEFELKLVEFGGRPIFYGLNKRNLPLMKHLLDMYKRYRHLQFEFIDRHERLSDGVFATVYSNGETVVCNYTTKPFAYRGETVPPQSFIISKKK